MFWKRVQLGLVHVAVSMTLVPINSTLNRIMIKEFAISATLVAVLASLPYLFSPIQVAIGSFSDKHPLWGLRRTPYIVIGLLLCVSGVIISPYVAIQLFEQANIGLLWSVFAFGAWGMGFNFATVSYFSLASEISGEKGRGRTIATMFFMMIISIIFTAALLSSLLTPYSQEALTRSFSIIAGIAVVLGVIGILGLERPVENGVVIQSETYGWGTLVKTIAGNRQATLFFWYLILLLTAILGQDILLEPYGAEVFNMSVDTTTRITSIWGGSFLLSLVAAGLLERKLSKFSVSKTGTWGAIFAFAAIVASGVLNSTAVFYSGVVLLGLATGLSTVSNLSLMLDMTIASQVGLFIGAWGMASAFARLMGNMLSGVLRDTVTSLFGQAALGYQVVFVIEAVMLGVSLVILRKIDVSAFKQQVKGIQPSVIERAAIAGEL